MYSCITMSHLQTAYPTTTTRTTDREVAWAEWSSRRTRNPAAQGSSRAMTTGWLSELLALLSVVPSLNPRPRL